MLKKFHFKYRNVHQDLDELLDKVEKIEPLSQQEIDKIIKKIKRENNGKTKSK